MTFSVSYKKEQSKLLIFVNDQLWRAVSPRLFGRKPQFDVNSFEELEELEYRSALHFAVRSLSAKSQHSSEIRKKLSGLGVSDRAIEQVATELQRLGVLDDRDWVESFVRSLMLRGVGYRAIQQKLLSKGLPLEEFEETLNTFVSYELQKEQIQKLITSKYGAKDLKDPKQKEQVVRGLARRGFSWDLISSSIHSIDE